jgi:hypothetical protein
VKVSRQLAKLRKQLLSKQLAGPEAGCKEHSELEAAIAAAEDDLQVTSPLWFGVWSEHCVCWLVSPLDGAS